MPNSTKAREPGVVVLTPPTDLDAQAIAQTTTPDHSFLTIAGHCSPAFHRRYAYRCPWRDSDGLPRLASHDRLYASGTFTVKYRSNGGSGVSQPTGRGAIGGDGTGHK